VRLTCYQRCQCGVGSKFKHTRETIFNYIHKTLFPDALQIIAIIRASGDEMPSNTAEAHMVTHTVPPLVSMATLWMRVISLVFAKAIADRMGAR
jgi:hypothetical protein